MKSSFFGFYPPSPDEYQRLWTEGLIVLDTNVLLNLYRLPTVARDELISVLESLKERLWIPHQVALEFQRKRLTVIAGERKSMEDALTSSSALVTEIQKKVDALQIEKRGLGIEPEALIADLNKANGQLVDAIQKAHNSQLDISASDPVRERLDMLLAGRVGVGPANQAELDALCADGEERYRESMPPGFMDADKDKNPREATFIFDHIKYQRKYGDLILWRQIMRHAQASGIKTVLLITADRKEDWWWREQGKTIGPHPELVREIRREGQVELFWMYSSGQFVEQANTYTTAKVSTESVAEIQNVMSSRPVQDVELRDAFLTNEGTITNFSFKPEASQHYPYFPDRPDYRELELAVEDWLANLGNSVEINQRGFPDLLVHQGEYRHGYEIKFTRDLSKSLLSPVNMKALVHGYMETKEGRLSTFTLVLVTSHKDFFDYLEPNMAIDVKRRCLRLLRKYPVHSIIVGAVINGTFQMLTEARAFENDSMNFDEE
jgi:hypothetical protein